MSTSLERLRRPAPCGGLVAVDGRRYPLEQATITARADSGIAATVLHQTFHNPYDEPLEVRYTLPLPADGAVIGYTMTAGGRIVRGVIEQREAAREAFEKALFEGRTAALLEQDRDDVFTQQLGAIPAGERVRIEIEVLHLLAFLPATTGETLEPARWEYRFPTVVGIRYQGEEGQVADAERMAIDRDADGGIPARISLELHVTGLDGEADVVSPSHAVTVERDASGFHARLADAARLDRDVVVRWRACRDSIAVRLVEGAGLPGDDGRYALLAITPPARPVRTYARDLTLLIDASGSMTGEPIACAKQVAADLLRTLGAGDRFEVLAFADQVRRLTRDWRNASERAIDQAVDAIQALEAGGGTEMIPALRDALMSLRPDAQRQVVLITDGQVSFEPGVMSVILDHLPPNARLHVVAIGAAPNRGITCAASRAGRGIEVMVRTLTDAPAGGDRLAQATVSPVLVDLSISGSALRGAAPKRPSDLFAGRPLRAALELEPAGGFVLVSAREPGTAEVWRWRIEIPARDAAAAADSASIPIGALYGRESIADLDLEISARPEERAQVEQTIEAVALRHRIVSRFTSMVAIAETSTVDPTQPRRRERLPVEIPDGVSATASGLSPHLLLRRSVSLASLSSMPTMLARLVVRGIDPTSGPGAVPALEARVIRVEGSRLTLEIEAQYDGFLLPDRMVMIEPPPVPGGRMQAHVVSEMSSPIGPHARGLVLRLTLELLDDPWPRRGLFTCKLLGPAPDGSRAVLTIAFDLEKRRR